MFDIDIYIETTYKGPAKKAGAGMWLIAYQGKELHTKHAVLWLENGTGNEAAVRCLRSALSVLTRPCDVRVHTTCGYLFNTLDNGWVERWRSNKWRTSDGEPIRHVEDWCAIDNMLATHLYTAVNEAHHSYTDWMQSELLKEESRHEGQKAPKTA